MQNNRSYRISDKSAKNAKLATEIRLTFGYRIDNSLKFPMGYDIKCAGDVTNNSVSLEGSLRF
ncbi:MAG: hypothetical protein LBB13_03415 [Rickettsiales bacterium]|jgi:hypothetical protein|nr:hypothetical protein [Rickettsiales bacterium]